MRITGNKGIFTKYSEESCQLGTFLPIFLLNIALIIYMINFKYFFVLKLSRITEIKSEQ